MTIRGMIRCPANNFRQFWTIWSSLRIVFHSPLEPCDTIAETPGLLLTRHTVKQPTPCCGPAETPLKHTGRDQRLHKMVKSFNFLAPSLHPNTLLDIAFPLAGPSAPDPLVKSLAVKYASDGHDDFQPLGLAKVMSDRGDGTVRLASACGGLDRRVGRETAERRGHRAR